MDLFQFKVGMSVDYFVWGMVKIFILDSYIYYSYTGSSDNWAAAANFCKSNTRLRLAVTLVVLGTLNFYVT